MSRRAAYLYLSIAAVLVILVAALLRFVDVAQKHQDNTLFDTASNAGNISAEHERFAALVSYTERGFEPSSLSVYKGDTVRFTNNTPAAMHIRASGSELYPSVLGGCARSALDSCIDVPPGGHWEFQFMMAGEWTYIDMLHSEHVGSVRVRTQQRPAVRQMEMTQETQPRVYVDPDIPAPTTAVNGYVLVEHNAAGFAPSNLTVHAGTVVKFRTDVGSVRITAAGEAIYPKRNDSCARSAFDSCETLLAGEEWEMRFDEVGTWTYYNGLKTSEKGIIRVI